MPNARFRSVITLAQMILLRLSAWSCLAILQIPVASSAIAAPSPVRCNGAALSGGAQMLCSHTQPRAPAQTCTYSWALVTLENQTNVVSGSFLIQPGASQRQVYRGSGFDHAAFPPIVLCQPQGRAQKATNP